MQNNNTQHTTTLETTDVEAFIERWRGITASELATAQSFVMDLCELLGVAKPHPTPEQDYMFERPVVFQHGDGSTTPGRIDCYKRGHFVLEAKKIKAGAHTKSFDDALMRARAQGENYARNLPPADGRPPFVVVLDVGNVIELYAEFSCSGGTYIPFPDPRSHRIRLEDLRQERILERLRGLWTNPLALDPTRANARLTRQVALLLADVACSLENAGNDPHHVASFLTRCLFSMFAEDVGLLPQAPSGYGAFTDLLKRHRDHPKILQRMLVSLWNNMDKGGFSEALTKDVLRFNGQLFKSKPTESESYALLLNTQQVDWLLQAARANWVDVEPAIFGALLENALNPQERHAQGAHYTPRAYVERLVLPTVIEPLRAEWADAQAAALLLANEANELKGKKREAKLLEARAEVKRFHHRLCTVRILDPACGSGNFLYVTLEHLKRLEGEILNQLEALGETQSRLGIEGESVTLQQLRGIELNDRAAALAELVLWIGYLQWHIRTFGNASVAEPVIHDYKNIENRDAVLGYDSCEPLLDEDGEIVTHWDGFSFKKHPITQEMIPDTLAQVVQLQYHGARQAVWPQADFIIGNPPFIGNKRMQETLGSSYTAALRAAWPEVPESADLVMYWWNKAAETVRRGDAEKFGLITTNSITMVFNRRVLELHQSTTPPLSIIFAIPDHPWSNQGAAVRIAMTVAKSGHGKIEGELNKVIKELQGKDDEVEVILKTQQGLIHSDLTVGANIASVHRLKANELLSNRGVIPHGAGFIITPHQAKEMGLGKRPGLEKYIRPYRNCKDLTSKPRGVLVIDLYGLNSNEVLNRFPEVFQWLSEKVKPLRDANRDKDLREKWWLHRRNNMQLRRALRGLPRYIVTGQVTKHRVFQWLDNSILPDDRLIAIASADALHLGVLSSAVHGQWALVTGGHLGLGNDPIYNKTRCFDAFPFPTQDTGLTPELAQQIRELAEKIDAHRKDRQAAYADVTITSLYNTLAKRRSGEMFSAEEVRLNTHGLVGILEILHDNLDTAVLQAYGWPDLKLPQDTHILLERLVELNHQRATQEAAGIVHWLRPDFQQNNTAEEQGELDVLLTHEERLGAITETTIEQKQRVWPTGMAAQIKAVAEVLKEATQPLGLDAIANTFTGRGRWKTNLPMILDTLEALGRTQRSGDVWCNIN